jgi:tRNA(Ser,Leu) C12 N-acetylase TAN1
MAAHPECVKRARAVSDGVQCEVCARGEFCGSFRYEAMMGAPLDWNLVVTAHGGRRHDLVYALRPIVRLRRAGYSEVLVGRADDVDRCLDGIRARADADPNFAAEVLARVVPVARTFPLGADVEGQLRVETATFLDALVGRTFHVRVERRGHKQVVQSDRMERALGTALVEELKRRGATPRVTFADPDLIVAVELIGDTGGVGLVSRELRARYPFVRL